MATSLPHVVIARTGPGWLTTCTTCGWEHYAPMRPAADRAAHDHRNNHTRRTTPAASTHTTPNNRTVNPTTTSTRSTR